MSLSQRQLIGLLIVVVTAAIGFLAGKENPLLVACLAALGGLVAVVLSATPQASLGGVRKAIRQASSGRDITPPEGAPPELTALYEELSLISERIIEQKEALSEAKGEVDAQSKKLREEKLQIERQLTLAQEEAQALRARPDIDHSAWLSLKQELEQLRSEKSRWEQRLTDAASAAVQLDNSVKLLSGDIAHQLESSEQTADHIKQMTANWREIAQHVELLASSAEESSSSILEMSATNDEVAENIGELGASVRETVASIEEMAYSIKEVATNVDALSLTAEETSSSMNEMDVSIDQVQSNANETARLSEEVAQDAERGAESILKTIGEIYRIKESSQEAVSVISNLGSRIDAIGQILNVIDEVAEQTNLLALNAAIIAAQAGEHGKGFAVVADELKDLAERAGAGTKEIADLIKTIQAESKNAIQAVERGAQKVDRGVEVSNEAERALKKILESSQKSTNMVRAIARATVEQAKGSKQVTDAIGRIAETVQQIAAATAQQARGSELIMKSGETMRTISQQMERSSQEQTRGGRQITQAIENISNMVNQLNVAHREQARGSEAALAAATQIEEAAKRQNLALSDLIASSSQLKLLVK